MPTRNRHPYTKKSPDVGHTLRANEVDCMVRSAPQETQRLRYSKHLQQTLEKAMAWNRTISDLGSGRPQWHARKDTRGRETHNLPQLD